MSEWKRPCLGGPIIIICVYNVKWTYLRDYLGIMREEAPIRSSKPIFYIPNITIGKTSTYILWPNGVFIHVENIKWTYLIVYMVKQEYRFIVKYSHKIDLVLANELCPAQLRYGRVVPGMAHAQRWTSHALGTAWLPGHKLGMACGHNPPGKCYAHARMCRPISFFLNLFLNVLTYKF